MRQEDLHRESSGLLGDGSKLMFTSKYKGGAGCRDDYAAPAHLRALDQLCEKISLIAGSRFSFTQELYRTNINKNFAIYKSKTLSVVFYSSFP